MMEDNMNLSKDTGLGGFTEIFDHIATRNSVDDPVEPVEPTEPVVEPTEPIIEPVEPAESIVDPIEPAEPAEPIEPIIDPVEPIEPTEPIVDPINLEEEEEMITPFVDLFSEKLGWEIEDENKPKSIDELIEFMDKLVDESSKPRYFSEDIKKLDEFVKNGGDIRKFLNDTTSGINLEDLDISNELNQKSAIKEHMKILKYSDDRITKKINRFEESGILEEEAEESVEFLQGYRQETKERLLSDQQKQADDRAKEQQIFISTVEDIINKSNTILGVSINTAQKKKELIDYILKVDAQGRTKNQIDYSKDPIQKLIETAFIQKEGKNFENNLNIKAQNNAVSNFKNKLKNTKKRGNQQQAYQSKGGGFDLISSISKQLL